MKNRVRLILLLLYVFIAFSGMSCMRYLTTDHNRVLLEGVDIQQTLKIASVEMERKTGRLGSSLFIWVIRDQNITPDDASVVAELYQKYIDSLKNKFDVWHLTWAISNMYKSGDDSVKAVLQAVYDDAVVRAEKQKGLADKMVNGEKIYRGDAHSGGRAFARKHVVVPGNKKYQQSFDQYMKRKHGT
ncbi:MAG: hypothetical protein GX640_01430 [Fibrobacter sp.]|nr:hypothetical protein [Fibrobacter sp.]